MDSPPAKPSGQFVPTLTTGAAWDELLDGMSRAEFVRATGVPRESLARWAKGGRARRGSVAQVAIGIHRDVAYVQELLDRIASEARAKATPRAETAETGT